MASSADSSAPSIPADLPGPVPAKGPGFARRAAQALRKARSAVWRSDSDEPATTGAAPDRQVVSITDLTERLKLYMNSADVQKVKAAFRYSDAAHLGQFRRSGEPYITCLLYTSDAADE